MSGWVKVSDRLPDAGKNVLVRFLGLYMVGDRDEDGAGWYLPVGWYSDDEGGVTHWMPLPNPPGSE